MIIKLTEEEMNIYSDEIHRRYPWVYRENTIYEAELVCYYKVKVDKRHVAELHEIINR